MASSGINLSGTHEFTVTIHYNDSTVGAGNMSESITDETTSANFTTTYSTDTKGNPINIPGVMAGADTAFIGFGGSGAGAVMTTYIDTWVYTVESPARPTPTPRATAKAAATATRTATGTARRYLPDRRDIVASEMMGF